MHVLGTISPPIGNFDQEVVGGMEGGKGDTKKTHDTKTYRA